VGEKVPLKSALIEVDPLGDDVTALDDGDELAALDEAFHDGVVGGRRRIFLSVNHLLAVEGDRRLDGAVIGRRLVELDALLEGDFRRLEGGGRHHLPRVAVLCDDEVGLERVAHLAQDHTDAEMLHVLVEALLRLQTPRADKRRHNLANGLTLWYFGERKIRR